MTMAQHEDLFDRAAAELLRQHRSAEPFRSLTGELRPADIDAAYGIQERLHRLWLDEGRRIAGWKVALTSKVMQELCGVDQPAAGAVMSDRVHASTAEIRGGDFLHIGVESEIALSLSQDLPPTDRPYDRESAGAAVGACMAATEIVEDRNADYSMLELLSLVADNAWNGGVVLGPELADWGSLRLDELCGRMMINGELVGEGYGRDVLGHPMESLAWLANHLNQRGNMLRAGDIVMTGSVVATKWLKPGDEMRTVFDGLGEALLRVA